MLNRFRSPKNVGDLIGANAAACARDSDCNDYIELKIIIEEQRIVEAKFMAYGCPGVISTTDVFIDLIKGRGIKEALAVTKDDISEALNGIPIDHWHCANLPMEALRRAMKSKNSAIIGVTGGKGGTGKSTVATALAYGLAKDNRVLLVDADVGCPNDHLLLGVERKFLEKVDQRIPEWDFAKCRQCGLCGSVCRENAIVAVKERKPMFVASQCNGCGACALKCPEKAISWSKKEIGQIYVGRKHNIDMLSGELVSGEPIAEIVVNELKRIVKEKSGLYDYIIIDTAAGLHCDVIAALKECRFVLAVAEPTPLGEHDLKLMLKLFDKMELSAGIVLNKADAGNKEATKKLAKKHKLEILAEIPYTEEIIKAYSRGLPVKHRSITNLIKRLQS
ncbi:MAG: iron-sulfur cluster assembly scaffold protein [Candidatus Falkowbacteria bacterium]